MSEAPLKKAGVIGWPVAHSLSPALHGYWLKHYGISGSYELLPTEPHRLGEFLQTLGARGYIGANVTVPHKEFAAKAMDRLSDTAKALGAVNLIIVNGDGSLEGRNTDGFGFVENLKAGAPGIDLKDTPVCLLGSGGTTKAVAYALLQEGARLWITNRTQSKAEALADQLRDHCEGHIQIVPWAERVLALQDVKLLVNTTSLGMAGQPALSLDLGHLSTDATVTDCVYAPLETELLKNAKANGCRTVDGLGMLIHQARPAFKAWFGIDPQVTDELRDTLIKRQQELST